MSKIDQTPARARHIAGGYFLSRHVGDVDCTGTELRRLTLASDHSQRAYFPDSWIFDWVSSSAEDRIEAARHFQLSTQALEAACASLASSTDVGVWSVVRSLDAACAFHRAHLSHLSDVDLIGAGLHESLRVEFEIAHRPPPPRPGYSPMGTGGVFDMLVDVRSPLAPGGTALGYEILVYDVGSVFNSLESRHADEAAIFGEAGIVPNAHGLIDSFDDALTLCRRLEGDLSVRLPNEPRRGWLPWLLVRYPID